MTKSPHEEGKFKPKSKEALLYNSKDATTPVAVKSILLKKVNS